ncbi:TonB-dependent receptor [Sphingosinicella sp. BN140058]|uniref:TonB-dependent receptor n=1 Tax=Sphingosinicella sp. BN140058 TaxID=1892855 RepID=UPI001012EF63|nr:TonB-dependent receptor [Sphingosinicella sp. BN140058]QAY76415.1 TonB-dependent receptor [Sphingosinicella sp. BN140058]
MTLVAHRRARLLGAACLSALLASAAQAQDAADQVPAAPQTVPQATDPAAPVGPGAATNQPGDAAGSQDGLEEIVITAERREQSLQDIPISATVFSANEIARRGITNLADVQQSAPSVAINTVNRSTFINIRGVGIAQSAPTSNPGIAYYIDGQLIPHEQFIGQSFYDIGAIEVLRGPQGTLTGQNSTGGAIYVRTPEPEFNATSGYLEQTIGNFDSYRTTGAINWGPNDNVAVRIAGIHDQRDSFSENIGPSPSQPGSFNLDSFRVNLALRTPDQRLKINVRGEYFDYRSDNIPVKNRGDIVPALRDPAQPALDPRQSDAFVIREDAISFLNQQGYRLSGEVRYDLSDAVQIRGLTSWQDGYTHDQADGDRGLAPINLAAPTGRRGRVSRASTDFRTFINEINLLSTGKGPFQWVIGAFSLDETVPLLQLRDDRSQVDIVSATLNRTVTEATNTSQSLFGQANWFATDRIELIAGARYSWDKQVYDRYEVSRTITQGIGTPVTATPITGVQKSTALTGKVGVNFHATDDVLLYATASKGYKAGGVNLTPNTPNFGPEKNFVYEAGIKAELLDRHLRINADVFRSDYKDIQLASLLNGLPLTQNAASGKAWGAEFELTAQFGGFSFNGGVGWLDAAFADDVCVNNTNNPAGTPALCGGVADQLVPKGQELPFSPEWTINAGAQYAFALGNDVTLTPRVQWSHVTSQIGTPFPSAFSEIPGRDVIDARLTLDFGDRYRLEAFVNNLTDELYIASQIQNASSANGGYVFGAPRQYGVRGTVRF